ncbi:MAG: hypothetical protein LQ340_000372 [Diploschistes diacapsis]|nr:MAG: hypothetical protein LQ340_000372 [Diploschistes diacapsis]
MAPWPQHGFEASTLSINPTSGYGSREKRHCGGFRTVGVIGRDRRFTPAFATTDQTCIVEQDLTVTLEKTLAINSVMKKLGLQVMTTSKVPWLQADSGCPDFETKGPEWPYTTSEEHGVLYTPRVVVTNEVIAR